MSKGHITGLEAPPRPDNAEPVAWRWRYKSAPDEPGEWHAALAEFYGDDLIVEPLYTAPPRPDASAEIAELAARCRQAEETLKKVWCAADAHLAGWRGRTTDGDQDETR